MLRSLNSLLQSLHEANILKLSRKNAMVWATKSPAQFVKWDIVKVPPSDSIVYLFYNSILKSTVGIIRTDKNFIVRIILGEIKDLLNPPKTMYGALFKWDSYEECKLIADDM